MTQSYEEPLRFCFIRAVNPSQSLGMIPHVKSFLKIAGKSLESFTYFDSRPAEVITHHLVTFTIEDTVIRKIVAYGHLDPDSTDPHSVWLGICVAESYQGFGFGKDMMAQLISYAYEHKRVHRVILSVHKDNERAIGMYKKFGFVQFEESKTSYFMGLKVK